MPSTDAKSIQTQALSPLTSEAEIDYTSELTLTAADLQLSGAVVTVMCKFTPETIHEGELGNINSTAEQKPIE
jgi:hypothetical protein